MHFSHISLFVMLHLISVPHNSRSAVPTSNCRIPIHYYNRFAASTSKRLPALIPIDSMTSEECSNTSNPVNETISSSIPQCKSLSSIIRKHINEFQYP